MVHDVRGRGDHMLHLEEIAYEQILFDFLHKTKSSTLTGVPTVLIGSDWGAVAAEGVASDAESVPENLSWIFI